ncbi:MAG: carbohydrate kinase family protein [Candidatus Aenigmarchaeota archaeon]|nr:carbohydrate kinase family protein [Candidatus Aenigmarchaeota archaeon]
MDIVVIGSAMVDIVIHTNRLVKLRSKFKNYLGFPYGSKTEIEELEFNVGGSGHNIAVGLSKLGNKVGFIGRIGNDPNGLLIANNFKMEGVDTRFLKKTKEDMTGFSQVFITPDGEKSILTHRGINDSLSSDDIPEDVRNVKWLVFTTVLSNGALDAVRKTVEIVKRNGGKILANPSITMVKHRKRELLELIKKSDIVIMNKEEVRELMNSRSEKSALKKLLKLGVQSVVVTLGKKGLISSDKNIVYKKKPFKVKIVDTTGAGDGFTAGFLHWLMKTNSFEDALTFGSATAALNIESIGATKNLPSEKDIINLIGRK